MLKIELPVGFSICNDPIVDIGFYLLHPKSPIFFLGYWIG